MLWILEVAIVVVLILWLLGAFIVPVGGSIIHLLLVLILILVVVRVIMGQPVL